jgi:hypothetical protein
MSKGRVACSTSEYPPVSIYFIIRGTIGRTSLVVHVTLIAKVKALALPHFFPVPAKVRTIWITCTVETRGWGWCCHCGDIRPFS